LWGSDWAIVVRSNVVRRHRQVIGIAGHVENPIVIIHLRRDKVFKRTKATRLLASIADAHLEPTGCALTEDVADRKGDPNKHHGKCEDCGSD
jgi:hypothetical protein